MYLKRLDLQGFKSFATRTVFEFGPGITAVVGPNGVGKTNVAEAIRWVLGEQTGRALRARRTEDVIFAGSSTRPPVGMAEVSITLDNSDGWLPIDFSEVVVTRRAYRNGEGEYFINRSRVRLKDVVELFLKAQVGQNSYAFMGQGLVERVLSLRPEERRGLIEEAADVRLYRTRLEEAQDRLAATRENLERVGLLVAEIEPRLAQLERQANRAAIHARLSQELAQALQARYGHLWQEAQEALAAARAVCDQRQEEFERAGEDVRACEEGLSALRSAMEERQRDITSRERAKRDLERYVQDLEGRVTLDRERGAMLASRQDELAADLAALQQERAEQQAAEGADPARERELLGRLEETRAELAARKQEAGRLDRELSQAQQAAARAEQEAAQARLAAGESAARLSELAASLDHLREEGRHREEARRALLAELKDWSRGFRSSYEQHSGLVPRSFRAEAACQEMEARVQEERTTAASLEEELRRSIARIETLEARQEVLGSVDTHPLTPDAGIRAVLAAAGILPDQELAQGATLEGVVGLVGQLLRVPPGMEKAIEAALAENLHALVVERQEHLDAVIDLLRSDDLGRATIYPLDGTREGHSLHLLKERGIIGVASQLVQCEGRYRRLVETLLGHTIVVENLALARVVLKRSLGSVVTLDGVLLRPAGSMSAGSFRTVREAFVRQRLILETPQELESLRLARPDLEASLQERRRALAEAEEALAARKAELDTLRGQRRTAEAALAERRSSLAVLRARLLALHAEAQRMRASVGNVENSVAALERQQAEHFAAAQRAEKHALEARRQADELEARRRSLAQEVAEAASREASLEGEIRALAQVGRSFQDAQERLDRQLSAKEEQSRRLEKEASAVTSRLEGTRRELEERVREMEGLERDLEPARQALAQLQSREHSLSEELTNGQARALSGQRGLVDAAGDVRIRQDELDSLRATLEAEGLSVDDRGEVVPAAGEEIRPPTWLSGERVEGRPSGDELPPMRGSAPIDPAGMREQIASLRAQIRSLGPVNEQAQADYGENKERYDFLTEQLQDLRQAEASLRKAIAELEEIIRDRFKATFEQVNEEFQRYFATFFGGGTARLILTRPEDGRLGGVDIEAQPPGKRLGSLAMLSGGERALTAVAVLFALLQAHPSPICVLDEVDAAMDEANVGRFVDALRELTERIQFVIITHNRRTIEMADTIYGVSMGEDSTSDVLSLRLSDISPG